MPTNPSQGDSTDSSVDQTYGNHHFAPAEGDPTKIALEIQRLHYIAGALNPGSTLPPPRVSGDRLTFDEKGIDTTASYEPIDLADLEQDADGWVTLHGRIRLSVVGEAVTEAQDLQVQYRMSEGDTGQQLAETTNISAGARAEVIAGENVEPYSHFRLRGKYNSTDGGTLTARGNFT